MTRYERIRQEIIAVEREIAMLRHAVKDEREQESFRKICQMNERIRDTFSDVPVRPAM